jgi:hypothetical protein
MSPWTKEELEKYRKSYAKTMKTTMRTSSGGLISIAVKKETDKHMDANPTTGPTLVPPPTLLPPGSTGGRILGIAGVIGVLLSMGAVAIIPPPWGILVSIVGVVLATLAGLAAKPLEVTGGSAVLQGTALAVVTFIFTAVQQFYSVVPEKFQPIVWGILAVLGVLTGKALPALGSPPKPV